MRSGIGGRLGLAEGLWGWGSKRKRKRPPEVMEEEAIITEVRLGTQRSLGEGLSIASLQVGFQLLRSSSYQDKGYKVTFKSPSWLAELEPLAPIDGYLMEHGALMAELAKDERIKEDLRVIVEVSDV